MSSLLGSKGEKNLVDQLPELLIDVDGLVTPALVNKVTDISDMCMSDSLRIPWGIRRDF